MPQHEGPLSAIADIFVQQRAALAQLPERERAFARAGYGAGMVAAVLYVIGDGAASSGFGLALCALLLVWGCWMLAIGVNRSQGQRDALSAGKAIPGILIGGAGLIFLSGFWLLTAAWIACLVEGLTVLVLSLRRTSPGSLPDPRHVPGMPMSGPASRERALRAMSGKGGFQSPRFPD